MGKDALSGRDTWQDYSGTNAAEAERGFYDVFDKHFRKQDTTLRIDSKPNELNDIYVDYPLDSQVLNEIYTPEVEIKNHGIRPDYVIRNTTTNKSLYVEVKRQDGWVEGKPRSAGRGNAHERSCKFFTPGLLSELRRAGNIQERYLPFWTVFQGDIARDPCRVREVTLWYKGVEDHFFFWRSSHSEEQLLDHFYTKLKKIID